MAQYKEVNRRETGSLSWRSIPVSIIKLMMVIAVCLLFAAVWHGFYREGLRSEIWSKGNFAVLAVYLIIYVLFARLYGGFQVGLSRAGDVGFSQAVGLFFADGVAYCLLCLMSYRLVNPLPLLGAWAAGSVLGMIWAWLADRLNRWLFPPKRSYIVYGSEEARRKMLGIERMNREFQLVDCLSLELGPELIRERLADAEAVFFCGVDGAERDVLLKFCVEKNIGAYVRPALGDLLLSGAQQIHVLNLPVYYCSQRQSNIWYRMAKRAIDLVLSGIAIVILSPVMLITGLCIHFYDGGPAFYRQTRLTRGGKCFSILKFRSMRVDAEKDGVARLSTAHDDRITPVGHFIRKVRLDELPQLFNIFAGHMSIVGPRPERPEIAAQYEEDLPEFRLRLQVKAGLTGYAQIYGKYNTEPYDKLQMDLIYIANQSIAQDLRLMLATVKILFMAESTEGVADGAVTARADSKDGAK